MSAAHEAIPFDEDLIGATSPVAVLGLTMAGVAARLGLSVSTGCDDLDLYEAAAVRAADEDVLLMSHRGNPGGRAQLYLRHSNAFLRGEPESLPDVRRRADAAIAALGLDDAVEWRTGEPDPGIEHWRSTAPSAASA